MITFPLLSGSLAAMLHVLTGPDHLAAVSPLAIESKRRAWKVGLMWGAGHVAGMMVIGILVYFFRGVIPYKAISAHSEKLVGLVLVGIGVWTLMKLVRKAHRHQPPPDHTMHKHPHYHDIDTAPYIHIHAHGHTHSLGHSHTHTHPQRKNLTMALTVGFIHGLAGIAHFLLFLPALGFKNNFQSAQYILGFGIGTVLAMSLYALVLGSVSTQLDRVQNRSFSFGFQLVSGVVATIVGGYWIFY